MTKRSGQLAPGRCFVVDSWSETDVCSSTLVSIFCADSVTVLTRSRAGARWTFLSALGLSAIGLSAIGLSAGLASPISTGSIKTGTSSFRSSATCSGSETSRAPPLGNSALKKERSCLSSSSRSPLSVRNVLSSAIFRVLRLERIRQ